MSAMVVNYQELQKELGEVASALEDLNTVCVKRGTAPMKLLENEKSRLRKLINELESTRVYTIGAE